MERLITKELIKWKNSNNRKPLLIQGAKQVGKTYTCLEFGKQEYSSVAYFNFKNNEEVCNLFSNPFNVSNLIVNLSSYQGEKIDNSTLIILDEIQHCENALKALSAFYENGIYHVIAISNLLPVAVSKNHLFFPAGKIDHMVLYPMNFEEFLLALGHSNLVNQIQTCYLTNDAFTLHEQAISLFKAYLYIGGMPSVVKQFIETKDLDLIRHKQNEILAIYKDQMNEYNNKPDINKIKLVFAGIPTQLSKENKKFQYRTLKHGGRMTEFSYPIEWIILSGMANQIYKVEQNKLTQNQTELEDFKLYLCDVGLLNAIKKVSYEDILYNSEYLTEYIYGLYENYVFNELNYNSKQCYFWTSGATASIEFITNIGKKIVPIEIKDALNPKAKSLSVYASLNNPEYSIQITENNFSKNNNIKNVPFYATFCIK